MCTYSYHFNPRSGERSDFLHKNNTCPFSVFQSTLRRTERRKEWETLIAWVVISIHAPANGATKNVMFWVNDSRISIHAPANGATPYPSLQAGHHLFQSTLRRTERLACLHDICVNTIISIHAPANGATASYCSHHIIRQFQSTLRRTERPLSVNYILL